MNIMLFLAVTTVDKLKAVPPKFWWTLVAFILGFFVAVWLLKKLLRVNKVFLFLGVFVVSGVTFISWVYNRNEPAFLTPFVDQLAQFLPTKDAYAKSENKAVVPADQQKTPSTPTPPPPPHSNVY